MTFCLFWVARMTHTAVRWFRLPLILIAAMALQACKQEVSLPGPTAEPGVLQLLTEPGDAEIVVNGQPHGRSPAEAGAVLMLRLPAGQYLIEARKPVDEFMDLVGRVEVDHVDDKPTPPLVLRLTQRLTPAGEAMVEEEKRQRDAREQVLATRFQAHEDGTATDTVTGLTWMRCSIGQTWVGQACSGEVSQLSWHQALKASEGFVLAGHADWRLPTRDELYTLVYCSSGRRFARDPEGAGGACEGGFRQPAILDSVFPATPVSKYWSSTESPNYNYKAWGVAFGNGLVGAGVKTEYVAARLVRGTMQPPSLPAGN